MNCNQQIGLQTFALTNADKAITDGHLQKLSAYMPRQCLSFENHFATEADCNPITPIIINVSDTIFTAVAGSLK